MLIDPTTDELHAQDEKDEVILSYIQLGIPLTVLRGKVPVERNWQNTTMDLTRKNIKKISEGNYGVVIPEDILIVDVDPRNGGEESFKALLEVCPIDFQNTYVVKTGTGGYHVYLRKAPTFQTVLRLDLYRGIDFLTKGHQVVGPGSIHPGSGKPYTILYHSPSEIMDAPEGLLSLLTPKLLPSVKRDNSTSEAKKDYFNDNLTVKRYVEWLEKYAPTAVQGDNGDVTTFKVACRGRELGISPERTFACMTEYWNDRCSPPWGDPELRDKVMNAYKYGRAELGEKNLINIFGDDMEIIPPDDIAEFSGRPIPMSQLEEVKGRKSIINIVRLFFYDPDLLALLRFNEFAKTIEFARRAPWHVDRNRKEWSDRDATECKFYLATKHQCEPTTEQISEAAVVVAGNYSYHPVRNYLMGIEWDGQERLDTWLIRYCGCKDTPYVRAIGRKVLLAAVARVFKPGCKFDHMLVLEGRQGIGKSYVCKILGRDWAGDPKIDLQSKDTIEQMRGLWIIEMSEMEAASKAEVKTLRGFITRQSDRVRAAFARHAEDNLRQSIFIGTINPDDSGYLEDPTGNRRFWPVTCSDRIDYMSLLDNVDQLWGEAFSEFMAHKDDPGLLYLADTELQKEAMVEQQKREVKEPWAGIIGDWLDKYMIGAHPRDRMVTSIQIWEHCMHGEVKSYGKREALRIAKGLVELGWERTTQRSRIDGQVQRMFKPPMEKGDVEDDDI